MSNSTNETIELAGYLFEVAGTTTDSTGNGLAIPGKCLGKAPKEPKQNKRSGHSLASAPINLTAPAPTAEPAPQLTPTAPRSRRAPRSLRSSRPARGDYRKFRQKPAPIVIVNEPWTFGEWAALIVVLVLIVAGIWLSKGGN